MKTYRKGEVVRINLVLNGQQRSGICEPRTLLSDFLRHELGATGTHVGCEHGVCGACTVHVNGVAVRACLTLAVQADGAAVTTIEGISSDGQLTALQQAFKDQHGLQCGFCTPGILMTLTAADAREFQSEDHLRKVVVRDYVVWRVGTDAGDGNRPIRLADHESMGEPMVPP